MKYWSIDEIEDLKQMYPDQAVSYKDMMRRFGRSWRSIQQKAVLIGLHRRRTLIEVRRDYFKEISTAEQAYFLGLLAADGAVQNAIYMISLELQSKDIELVEKFAKVIAPGSKIARTVHGTMRVSVHSKEMAADLASFGIIQNKSRTFTWPCTLSEEFAVPFLLGYFDGDGCLSKTANNTGWQWLLVGTQAFLEMARRYIGYHAQVEIREPTLASPKSPHLYRIYAYGERAIKIDRTLNASGLGLARKHIK